MTAAVRPQPDTRRRGKTPRRRAEAVRPPRSPQDLARAIFAQADRKRRPGEA